MSSTTPNEPDNSDTPAPAQTPWYEIECEPLACVPCRDI